MLIGVTARCLPCIWAYPYGLVQDYEKWSMGDDSRAAVEAAFKAPVDDDVAKLEQVDA